MYENSGKKSFRIVIHSPTAVFSLLSREYLCVFVYVCLSVCAYEQGVSGAKQHQGIFIAFCIRLFLCTSEKMFQNALKNEKEIRCWCVRGWQKGKNSRKTHKNVTNKNAQCVLVCFFSLRLFLGCNVVGIETMLCFSMMKESRWFFCVALKLL